MILPQYDRFPAVDIPGLAHCAVAGWPEIARQLHHAVTRRDVRKTVIVVECYPGINSEKIIEELTLRLEPVRVYAAETFFKSPRLIEELVEPFLGGNDPVFGRMNSLELRDFFTVDSVAEVKNEIGQLDSGIVLVVGCGARLIHAGDVLVYADLARWEAQLRFRRKETGNLGAENREASAAAKYKRAFFVDWRVADRWKQPMMSMWDFVLDTHEIGVPKIVTGDAFRRGLKHVTTRPFRVVPFFDPAPWGGQWMREIFGLETAAPNYGWGFDCVPEENSLLLRFGEVRVEVPALDLVLFRPRELLGENICARFGDEFPIRFDLLDTMGGGNLSLQVHPLTAYIREHFGMSYTQDESYYLLETGEGAEVFLGLRDGVDPAAMERDLRAAQASRTFPAEKYAARWPAKRHDHFLIPAGTVHCSGANSVVLEISATPFIFTFKLWDWGRLGLNGQPRPIHLDHGLANIRWERDATWVQNNLINRIAPLHSGNGWRTERTGLHALQFIETRRDWFSKPVVHDTRGTVHVVNLVQGSAAWVESVDGSFEPFRVSYAETFIVPAAVGAYRIRPAVEDPAAEHATLRAHIPS